MGTPSYSRWFRGDHPIHARSPDHPMPSRNLFAFYSLSCYLRFVMPDATQLAEQVNWLFLDMNSYFASVEQQVQPHLRGKPVAVVTVDADSTVCIAASYEAKAFGVSTGTALGEARKKCPDLNGVGARPEMY